MRHDRLILERLLVPLRLVHPHVESVYHFGDVVGVGSEVKVADFASLIEERLIDEVPSGLPLAALGLDLVGEGGTLNHWVLVLG